MSDPTDPALWGLIAAAVPSGVVGLVSFFAKRAFAEVEHGIAKIGAQVEELHKSFTSQDTAVALLEMRLSTLEDQCRECRRKASEG